jgi:hypothetical protein
MAIAVLGAASRPGAAWADHGLPGGGSPWGWILYLGLVLVLAVTWIVLAWLDRGKP